MPDDELLMAIRREIAESPFVGEDHMAIPPWQRRSDGRPEEHLTLAIEVKAGRKVDPFAPVEN
jgi:hypothetical protein